MFDKLKYNNLIISGSKEIQKAKIQVLRKVIQKIQKLKKTVERKPDDESSKIKLRKCLAVVESAKKLKKFEALTNILLLEKCPNKIVTNSHSTPEEVAIAMLASNPTMKLLVTKTKKELSLSDADSPTWRKALIQISKRRIKMQRKKKRKQALEAANPDKKNTKKKTKKDSGVKKTEPVAKPANEENVQENLNDETLDFNVKNELKKPKTKPKVEKNKVEQSRVVIAMENSAAVEEIKTKKSKLELPKMDDTSAANLLAKIKTKKNKQPNVKNAFLDNESRDTEIDRKLSNSFQTQPKAKSKPKETEIKIAKIVDPFFVTSTGENYVAIAPVIEGNNDVNESKPEISEPKRRAFEPYKTSKLENERVHPSWAAKQKQRAPVGFQGKRKVFDDEASQQKTSTNSAASDLHPSWAAKQKLKPNITAFQGKKIKFDDE